MAITYSDESTECCPAMVVKPPSQFRLWQARFVLRESESEGETDVRPDNDDDRSVSSETGNDDDEYVDGSISGEEDDVDNSDDEDFESE